MKISKKATTIAIVNQKGGTGKTTTCENLASGWRWRAKKFCWWTLTRRQSYHQHGLQQPDELPATLSTLMQKAMNDQLSNPVRASCTMQRA